MRRALHDGKGPLGLAALAAAFLLVAGPGAAQMGSDNGGGGLSRSSRTGSSSSRSGSSRSTSRETSRSSRASSQGDEDFDDEGDEGDSRSSRSRSSSRRGSDGGSGGTRSFSTGGGKKGGGKAPETPPVVFGPKFERAGVRPRGTLLSVATFEALPCTAEPVSVGPAIYYRCGDGWFQRIDHEGWTCYSEIWPPAGAHVSSLPPNPITYHSGGRTLHAGENAWYERQEGGYVVIEPPVGLEVDRLPESAKRGIPVVVNGVPYHRHLGVFYREQEGAGAVRYVVSRSPYDLQPLAAAQAQSQTPTAGSGSLDAAGPSQPFVPSAPFAPMPSTPSAHLAPSVATTSPTPYYVPGAATPPADGR